MKAVGKAAGIQRLMTGQRKEVSKLVSVLILNQSVCPPHQTNRGLRWSHQGSQVTSRRQSPGYEGKSRVEAARLQDPDPAPGHPFQYNRKYSSDGLACSPGLGVGQSDFTVSLHVSSQDRIKKDLGVQGWWWVLRTGRLLTGRDGTVFGDILRRCMSRNRNTGGR